MRWINSSTQSFMVGAVGAKTPETVRAKYPPGKTLPGQTANIVLTYIWGGGDRILRVGHVCLCVWPVCRVRVWALRRVACTYLH